MTHTTSTPPARAPRAAHQRACGLALTLLAGCSAPPPPRYDGPPNFVIVVIDSMRADRLDPEGEHPPPPALAGLLDRGVRFSQARSNAGWTLPGVTSLLSGRAPVPPNGPPDAVPLFWEDGHTLPEILALYGWSTHAVWRGAEVAPVWRASVFQSQVTGDSGEHGALVQGATGWLDERPPGPFLLWLHQYNLAHQVELNDLPGGTAAGVARYGGLLTAYDTVLGELFARLDELGLASSTVVVVTSDHGIDLAEHRPVISVAGLTEADLRIPLVIADPRQEGGQVVDQVVQGMDLAPTVLALAGLQPDVLMEGRSLTPLLADPHAAWPARDAFSLLSGEDAAMLSGSTKVVTNRGPPHLGPAAPPASRFNVYDLASDPLERKNLYDPGDADQLALIARLRAWLGSLADPTRSTLTERFPPDAERVMREQGYFQIITDPSQAGPVPAGAYPRPPPAGAPAQAPPSP